MNRDSKSKPAGETAAGGAKARDLFVVSDLQSIPVAELRPICGGAGQWLWALLRHKLLRAKSPPSFALELLRFDRVEAAHVPKRLLKAFDAINKRLQKLELTPSFYANIPALGSYSSAIMGMSRDDGEIHCCAFQVARKTAGGIIDQGHLGFFTWLRDERCLATFSAINLPRLSGQVEAVIERSDDPAALLKSHRDRLLTVNPQAVAGPELFEKIESEYRVQIDDLQRRGVIRRASNAEVARIRNDIKV